MLSRQKGWLAGVLAAVVLMPLLWLRPFAADARFTRVRGVRPPPPRTASQKALRAALRSWYQAQDAANAQLDTLQAWDPAAIDDRVAQEMRKELLAADPNGLLTRARDASKRAWASAQTGAERCRAAGLLSRIQHDTGNHEAELRQARAMVEEDPESWLALVVLRRAARCNGDHQLERRAVRGLRSRRWTYYDPEEQERAARSTAPAPPGLAP
jgi:hypothetical protein